MEIIFLVVILYQIIGWRVKEEKMEDTLEKRILKSNLSDDDKITIIKLIEKAYNHPVYVPTIIPQINTPVYPYYTEITC